MLDRVHNSFPRDESLCIIFASLTKFNLSLQWIFFKKPYMGNSKLRQVEDSICLFKIQRSFQTEDKKRIDDQYEV